jgi:hypothetical protein
MKGWTIGTLAWLVAAAAGCSMPASDDTDHGGGDGETRCASNEECDDGIDCTVDTCGVGGHCQNQPINEQCEDGEACIPGRGCVAGACLTSDDCDDDVDCTVDTCSVDFTCDHQAVDALCEEDLAHCDPTAGCVSVECVEDGDCDDDVACTVDACIVGNVCEHTAHGELCDSGERCDPDDGCVACVPCDSVDDCTVIVDNFCDGIPRCEPEFGCEPPTEPRDCDDRNDCTIDACDPEAGENGQCVYAVNCELEECLEGHPECLWNGCFALDTTISQHCALGGVNYDIDRLCFELRGPSLAVRPDRSSYTLTQSPAPSDTSFDVSYEIAGGCIETYRITGSFRSTGGTVDRTTIDATWTATYTDHDGFSCALGGCPNQTIDTVGTRE